MECNLLSNSPIRIEHHHYHHGAPDKQPSHTADIPHLPALDNTQYALMTLHFIQYLDKYKATQRDKAILVRHLHGLLGKKYTKAHNSGIYKALQHSIKVLEENLSTAKLKALQYRYEALELSNLSQHLAAILAMRETGEQNAQ